MSGKERRLSYEAGKKREVILYAERFGNRAAEKQFGVSECNVRRWRKARVKLFECVKTRKAFTGPKEGRHPEIDQAVLNFVTSQRKCGLPVTRQMLSMKAKEEANTRGIAGFKASRGWCEKFMRRMNLSLRRRTSICQKLPTDFENKLINFQRYVIDLRKKLDYPMCHIGNADETPVYFDMPLNRTVTETGAKEVKMVSTGYEKHRVTVMLCVTADGNKLPPYIILNRKTIPKDKFPEDVIVRAQPKGWMTSELMEDWVKVVWNRRPSALRKPPNMLVLDAFKGHTTDQIKNLLKRENCELVVIPGGMTSQLQPLDVSINKPFKDHLRYEYTNWLASGDLPLTPSGKIKKASPVEVANWISTAWKKISPEIVRKSFKKCCISNALDGSEDYLTDEATEDIGSEPNSDSTSDSTECD